MTNGVVVLMRFLLFPVQPQTRPPDPTPLLQPHYQPSSLVRVGRPSAPHRYSRLVASTTCASPFTSERLVPAVPHKILDQLHAPFTPVAACPVIRFPPALSPGCHRPLV